jgi:hypothetical protein
MESNGLRAYSIPHNYGLPVIFAMDFSPMLLGHKADDFKTLG